MRARSSLVHDTGLDVYDMRYIDEIGMKRAMEEALGGIDADTHLHVSFDVDFLDPASRPASARPCRAARTTAKRSCCMEMIADTGRLGSLDIDGAESGVR